MKELMVKLQEMILVRNVDYAKVQEIIDVLHENGIAIMAVHNGEAHKDEMLACAVYVHFTGKDICVLRTRDMKIIAMADIIADVGMLYDGYRHFDHHQQGAPVYPNGVKYAACGMILERVCQDPCVKNYILEHALYAIQSGDNGQQEFRDQFEDPFDCLRMLNVSWRENLYGKKQNANFIKGVEFCKAMLAQMVEDAYAEREMEQVKQTIIDAINEAKANSKNYIVLNRYLPWHETVINYNDEHADDRITAVVFMSKIDDWKVQVVPVEFESFESWIKLDPDYCKSMSDFIFCHQGRFIAGFKSKESAVKVAAQCSVNHVYAMNGAPQNLVDAVIENRQVLEDRLGIELEVPSIEDNGYMADMPLYRLGFSTPKARGDFGKAMDMIMAELKAAALSTQVKKVMAVSFTDGVSWSNIPRLPSSLGTELALYFNKEVNRHEIKIITDDINDVVDWYESQFRDAGEGVLSFREI